MRVGRLTILFNFYFSIQALRLIVGREKKIDGNLKACQKIFRLAPFSTMREISKSVKYQTQKLKTPTDQNGYEKDIFAPTFPFSFFFIVALGENRAIRER
jgi:hypothetical protein